MTQPTTPLARPSGWSRLQSAARFVTVVLGWGPLAFCLAVPVIAAISSSIFTVFSIIVGKISLSNAADHLSSTVTTFMAASAQPLALITAIGIAGLAVGKAAFHFAAFMRTRHQHITVIT